MLVVSWSLNVFQTQKNNTASEEPVTFCKIKESHNHQCHNHPDHKRFSLLLFKIIKSGQFIKKWFQSKHFVLLGSFKHCYFVICVLLSTDRRGLVFGEMVLITSLIRVGLIIDHQRNKYQIYLTVIQYGMKLCTNKGVKPCDVFFHCILHQLVVCWWGNTVLGSLPRLPIQQELKCLKMLWPRRPGK